MLEPFLHRSIYMDYTEIKHSIRIVHRSIAPLCCCFYLHPNPRILPIGHLLSFMHFEHSSTIKNLLDWDLFWISFFSSLIKYLLEVYTYLPNMSSSYVFRKLIYRIHLVQIQTDIVYVVFIILTVYQLLKSCIQQLNPKKFTLAYSLGI